jgi:amino acid adenylation domain-containing protein/non-ribosomal peptide synthase protein (TIGR01720 family)
MVGLFINTLPVRVRIGLQTPVVEWLQSLQARFSTMIEYQYSPLARVQGWSDVVRGVPLFESIVVFENYPIPSALEEQLGETGLRVESLRAIEQTNYPLTIIAQPREEILLRALYDRNRLDTAAVARVLEHLKALLAGIAACPDLCPLDLPLVTDAERHQLLVEWNDTGVACPEEGWIHELFETQAARTPDALAVVFGGQHLTYRELNRRANQVAHRLQALGVERETLVGVCCERSPEMVIGLYAVLKAGGAYVPLDPGYPHERLAFVLEDSGVEVILAQARLAEGLLARFRVPRSASCESVVGLDAEWGDIARESDRDPARRLMADDLAYVIYTSGSTGRPKGVGNTHGGIRNRLQWMQETYALVETDRVMQKTPFSFDVSVWEFFWPLMYGACLVVAKPEGHKDGAYLAGLVIEENATTVHFVPSMLQAFVEMSEAAGCGSLRRVICSGETLSLDLQERFFGRVGVGAHPPVELHNMYGPTEAAIDVTYHPCGRGGKRRVVPIGRPIANTRIHLLDAQLRPVPAGVPGELHIGGAGLARGYHARPALTAARFIPDPFAEVVGARLYKTGDLARQLGDGNVEFLGRIDFQVKIRGFRIELGEIEAVLVEHPDVRETVVLAREDAPGVRRLVAYLVPDGDPPSLGDLRGFLGERLPEHMVPAVFVPLDALPLTPNGKVDRGALPAPDGARLELEAEYVAPRTPAERTLAAIWAQVLQLDHVGVHDNFFELGGDSILSVQIIARASREGLWFTVGDVFTHQTIAELAPVAQRPAPLPAEQGPVTGPVPLTPVQHWFFEQDVADAHHFNLALLLEVIQSLAPDMLREAVRWLLVHHDALRLRFERTASGWQQVNGPPGGRVPFTFLDLAALSDAGRLQALEQAAGILQATLDLAAGPLMRVALFHLGGGENDRLLLTAHHLVVDGLSWRILLEDLQALCRQQSQGQAPGLPPKTTSFRRWAERLAEYGRSCPPEEELEYWLAASRRDVVPLPVDHRGGANTVASARCVAVSLGAGETGALLREVVHVYHTQINDLLLTALARAFARWTGEQRLLVALEGHGREEILDGVDVSRTVGWFTSIYPVLLELEEGNGLGEALKSIQEQLRRVPARGVNYGVLCYLGASEEIAEALQALPRPEVLFNYLGRLDQALSDAPLLGLAPESSGPHRSLRGTRRYLLEVNGSIVGGELCLDWTYSEDVHRRATVEGLARAFLAELQAIIVHCLSPGAGGFTPSDFPEAQLEPKALDSLVAASRGLERGIEAIYPLTPTQQGMLFHDLYAPGSGTYLVQAIVVLRGDLNAPVFGRAWQRLVQQHAVLRSAFYREGLEQPLQVVYRHVEVTWQELDWRAGPVEQQQEWLRDLLQSIRRQGFEFSRPPLMRVDLVRTADDLYTFIWSFHHVLLDGWSLSRLYEQIFGLYAALRRGEEPHLDSPRPYREYVAWLQEQDLARAEDYWRRVLRGFVAPTPLPVGRSPAATGHDAESWPTRLGIEFEPETTRALRSLARRQHLTLNTLIQGAWALLLSRHSGERDVVFGATISGRPAELAGVESMVGPFLNTLPLRVLIDPGAPVLEWLRELQARFAEMLQFAYSPLVEVQGWSEVPRGMPLFESIVVLENYGFDRSLRERVADLGISVEEARALEQAHYPLALVVWPRGTLSLEISYDCRRFDAGAIKRMLSHLQRLLEGLVPDCEGVVAGLPMLAESELELLAEWNDTTAPYPRDGCIHDLLQTQAGRTPDAVALVMPSTEPHPAGSGLGQFRPGDDQYLTFDELDRRANQLAHHLRGLGVGVQTPVGICVERSLEMMVGLYAVLKAGGAYVPLDPGYPKERLAYMVDDSGVVVILTQARLADDLLARFHAPHSASRSPLVRLDADWEAIARQDARSPAGGATADCLAYVIYTSGSTGKPKGVAVQHRALLNLRNGLARAIYAEVAAAQLRVSLNGPLAFDTSVKQWLQLVDGCALCILPAEARSNARAFLAQLRDLKLDVVDCTPAQLRMLIDAGLLDEAESCPGRLLVGGDTIDVLAWEALAQVPGLMPYNLYGPTECTVDVTVARIQSNGRGPTIGRPLANVQVHLLDASLRLVPLEAPGELFVGGEGLALGYLGRPGLTAASFLPDPFSRAPGARMYRTGDRARYAPDGDLEFLGRTDNQAKVRGFRVEMAEIEAALARHPAVREAVAMVRRGDSGQGTLVAYVVADGQEPTVGELRRSVGERLPGYMVPSAFVMLETLPLTPNGKIDRRALPVPDGTRPDLDRAFVFPRSDTECTIAAVWQDVLGVDRIGALDDFFELGGHSLLATRAVSLMQSAFGLELPLRMIFATPTVAGMARQVDVIRRALEDASVFSRPAQSGYEEGIL